MYGKAKEIPDDVKPHRLQTKTNCCTKVQMTLSHYTAVHTLLHKHENTKLSKMHIIYIFSLQLCNTRLTFHQKRARIKTTTYWYQP